MRLTDVSVCKLLKEEDYLSRSPEDSGDVGEPPISQWSRCRRPAPARPPNVSGRPLTHVKKSSSRHLILTPATLHRVQNPTAASR